MQAIILAGGKGRRLGPITASIPKPIVPIGDMPILEIVLRQLKYYGVKKVSMAVNHLAEIIMAVFGDGKKQGLDIEYSIEDKALGTAGPLKLINNPDENFIVMNGDILTNVNYSKLFKYHIEKNADVTIAVYLKKLNIDLGVLEIEDGRLIDYIEKPVHDFSVSMGLYVINKRVLDVIKDDEVLDMPDLIKRLLKMDMNVSCYTGEYFWLDIGRLEDYSKAEEFFMKNRKEILPDG